MPSLLARLVAHVTAALRVIVPTFGVAGILVMSRTPDLWAMTDMDGQINGLPFLTIGCLVVTLLMLLRWRQQS